MILRYQNGLEVSKCVSVVDSGRNWPEHEYQEVTDDLILSRVILPKVILSRVILWTEGGFLGMGKKNGLTCGGVAKRSSLGHLSFGNDTASSA